MLSTKAKEQIMHQIHVQYMKQLMPIAIANIRPCLYFGRYHRWDSGWFIEVVYMDHVELWLVVDVSDLDEWYLEQVS